MVAAPLHRVILLLLGALSLSLPFPVSAARSANGLDLSDTAHGSSAQRVLRVALQVGHYKNDELPPQLERLSGHTGAFGGGRSEVDLNLEVAGRAAKLLRGAGVLVEILPATVPTGYTADAFVAIHSDGSPSTSARGFKISTRWGSVVARQDAMLVDLLTDGYRSATRLPEDSTVTRNMRGYYAYAPWRPNYRVSNFTPGAIVEMGFMTNASDRAVMFNQTDKVASGVASGILAFLKKSYRQAASACECGYGIVDDNIDPDAPALPTPRPGPASAPRRIVQGDWQALLMGKPIINVYSEPGSGSVVGTLRRGEFHHTTLRDGDYYRVILPDGKIGWVHRNSVITQT